MQGLGSRGWWGWQDRISLPCQVPSLPCQDSFPVPGSLLWPVVSPFLVHLEAPAKKQ